MKQCSKCYKTKELIMFPKRGNDCKACVADYMKEYRANNADHISQLKKSWTLKNIERVKANNKRYASNNPEKRRVARAKWRIANPQTINALTRNRRATKINRTPKWVDIEELWLIKEVYALATIRTKVFNFSWHVDHIIPLQGKDVCGLHTINNLQVIPGIENVRKGINYAK